MDEPLTKQAARAAYGWGRAQSWVEALVLLKKAAAAGEPKADRQLELVMQKPIEELLTPPAPERLTPRARVAVARGFAPPGFSEWLIDHSKDRLEDANVNQRGGNAVRTARACGFGPQQRDLILGILQERAARLLAVPVAFHEPPNTISYEPGQQFSHHVDFILPSVPEYQAELQRFGQRVGTVVTYLNDDFEGAQTVFPELGIEFRGNPGDAIFFANVLDDGTPDVLTVHFARPPVSGRKWVLSQWIRAKPYPYAPEVLV